MPDAYLRHAGCAGTEMLCERLWVSTCASRSQAGHLRQVEMGACAGNWQGRARRVLGSQTCMWVTRDASLGATGEENDHCRITVRWRRREPI